MGVNQHPDWVTSHPSLPGKEGGAITRKTLNQYISSSMQLICSIPAEFKLRLPKLGNVLAEFKLKIAEVGKSKHHLGRLADNSNISRSQSNFEQPLFRTAWK